MRLATVLAKHNGITSSARPPNHLKPSRHCGNDPTVTKHNGIPSATPPPAPLAMPFALRKRSYSYKSQWNSIGNSSTSTTCNPICIAETILQLQITMEFHRQLIHQHHLQSHLHCGNDPTVVNHNGILSTAHARKQLKPIYNAEPIRTWSEHDPNMIRPHTRPSPNRRTAEVDHRGSGTDFVWKNIGFRVSAISQKRISSRFPSKLHRQLLHQHHLQSHLQWENDPTVANHNGIPSAIHPPEPLAIPFTLRERSYSCKSQWNSVDRACTKHS